MTGYLIPLTEIGLDDAGRVGRKAATLGELLAAGFAVPPGFAVTADATDLPPGLAAELAAELARFGDGPVAVRSSGLSEDGPDLSYAGQYESVLGVRGHRGVLAAIRTCWASARSARVRSYQDSHGGTDGPARIAVLVQSMVEPSAAGVAFSRDPVGDTDGTAVVSAVSGLGDRLAAGQVDAEEWRVAGDEAQPLRPPAAGTGVLRPEQAWAVADLARRAARQLGAPQDIEWAFDGDTLWLLQSRPISTAPATPARPVPIPVEIPPGFSTRNRSMDRPWTPAERSAFLPVFRAGVPDIFRFTTGNAPVANLIGGWTYLTTPTDDPVDGSARLERVAGDLAAGRPLAIVRDWATGWRAAFAARTAAARDVDPAALTDAELVDQLDAVHTLFTDLHERYFQLTGAAIAIAAELGAACAELLGWSPLQTARLRSGLTGEHMAAAAALTALARSAAARPRARRWLAAGGAGPVDPEFAAALADYRRRYAHRTLGFDLTEPTVAEQPTVLLALIRAQLDRPYDLAAQRSAAATTVAAALAEARSALAERSAADRQRFEAAYAASQLSGPVRDEKAYHATSVWALLRYALRESGRRLVRHGVLPRVDDVFLLELDEVRTALAAGGDGDDGEGEGGGRGTAGAGGRRTPAGFRALIDRRRGELVWAGANPGPPYYGTPPQPPDADGPPLSSAAARAGQVARYAMSLLAGPRPGSAGEGRLAGLAAATGRYRGPVRVVRGLADFGKVRPGDVLVCPETTAQWSLLFCTIAALVTDRGSILSHPAILAREYRIPAVVATGDATGRLRDDDVVLVDGTAGVVLFADEPGAVVPAAGVPAGRTS